MAWSDLIDVMDRAAADAALAERVHRDRDFRTELRTSPETAIRRFELTAPRPSGQAPLREMPVSWRIRLEPGRARPVL